MQEEPNKVQKLNESLYSRNYKPQTEERSIIQPTETAETQEDWQSPNLDDMLKQERRVRPDHPVMKRIFIFALIFCLIAAALAVFIYVGGGNLISSKNVDIAVLGPVSISAGDAVDLGITITNKNNADLSSANLSIDYPEGSKDVEDPTKPLLHEKIAIGDLVAGKSMTAHGHALFFGQKGEVKEVKISVEYKVKGSVAIFSKEKLYEISIGASPLGIEITEPASTVSGNTFTSTVTIQSTAADVLKNIVIRAEYPYGFSLVSSTPTPATKDMNSWVLGDISPGDKKTLTIKGVLKGEDADERTFRFYAGVGNETGDIDSTLALSSATIALSRPAVALNMTFNGEATNPYIAPAGSTVQAVIKYQNNLPQTLLQTRIVATLTGASLDKFTILPQNGGFYNSSNNTIVWDVINNPSLSSIKPGDTGTLSFSFASQNNIALNTKSPEISVATNLTALPQGAPSADDITASDANSVRLASQVTLTSKALYSRGPFKNTGALPPKADKPTTYTVTLDLGNTQNEITDGKLTGTLGPNVTWISAATSTENVAYDATTNTVTWTVGTLAAGSGFSAPGRQANFQVSLTPSIGQIGSAPILFSNPLFKGLDSFTQKAVTVTNQSVTTRISTDPRFVQGNELVVK
ncbi:MAG: hypothetical protein JWL80_20 [Parcubacteria group bacterium]|nr:hypothetical protein [Parcubacteria group bacterium]